MLGAGPLLIFLIPFLLADDTHDRKLRWWCIALACVPIVGDATLHEIIDARQKDREKKELARIEAHQVEQIRTDPGGVADAIKDSDRGCEIKSAFLALEADAAEAMLAVREPALATAVFSAPMDLPAKIQFYDSLAHAHGNDGPSPAVRDPTLVQDIQGLLRQQLAYQKLAVAIRNLNHDYVAVVDLGKLHKDSEARTAMRNIAARLKNRDDLKPAAGYFNHLAMISCGGADLEDAGTYLSAGRAADPEHIPLYETLAYVLWIKDHQGEDALSVAQTGLALAEALPLKLQAAYKAANADYDAIVRLHPDLNPVVRVRRDALAARYPATLAQAKEYSETFISRLQLDVAYFSALAQTNELQAKQYINDLVKSAPGDPDFREGRGFVTMMFAGKNRSDLVEALEDINFAIQSSPAPNNLILYCFHYQECLRRQIALGNE